MSITIDDVIDAHGGAAAWERHSSLSVNLAVGGLLWGLKGQAGVLDHTIVTVGLRDEWASHHPFGSGDRRSRFAPAEVAIEDAAGTRLANLPGPRASFAGHKLETPWSEPQLAYFAGYAMWTYLNLPFLARYPGVEVEAMPIWRENGEELHPFRLAFPESIQTHSKVQTIYAGHDGLLRRHDYAVEIAGGATAAHYIRNYTEVDGIKFPTRRRVYAVSEDNRPMHDVMTVSIDLSSFTFDY